MEKEKGKEKDRVEKATMTTMMMNTVVSNKMSTWLMTEKGDIKPATASWVHDMGIQPPVGGLACQQLGLLSPVDVN